MDDLEYLIGYGLVGDFGRFRAGRRLACERGDRVVVRSHRGLEVGEVFRAASPHHALFLPNTTVGQLLRLATIEDERQAREMGGRGQRLLARAVELAQELALPLDVLDAEVLLDAQHAALHHLRWDECDVRPFVSALSREFELHLILIDLTCPQPVPEEDHGCGSCGSEGGGCGSCGSEGGGCGTCGTAPPEEVQAHFAGLREQMERRMPLL